MPRFINWTNPVLILLAVAVLLIFLHGVGILRPVENVVTFAFSPIQRWVYGVGTSINGAYLSIVNYRGTADENSKLREKVNSLAEENTQLRMLFADQQSLSLQQSFLTSLGYEYIAARVIGKNPESNFQALIIDRGSLDGINEGMPVVVGSGIMIGTISQVNNRTAEVIATSDSRSRIAALVENQQSSQGVVIGEHGLSLKMELISQSDEIANGTSVITSGLEVPIPRGLVLGEISRVESEPTSLFQTAYLKPFVKIDSVTVVSVIRFNNDSPDRR